MVIDRGLASQLLKLFPVTNCDKAQVEGDTLAYVIALALVRHEEKNYYMNPGAGLLLLASTDILKEEYTRLGSVII